MPTSGEERYHVAVETAIVMAAAGAEFATNVVIDLYDSIAASSQVWVSGNHVFRLLHRRQGVHLLACGRVEFPVDSVEPIVDFVVLHVRLYGVHDAAPVLVWLGQP